MPLPKAMRQLQSIGFSQADLQVITNILSRSQEKVPSSIVIEVADPEVFDESATTMKPSIVGKRSEIRSKDRNRAGLAR